MSVEQPGGSCDYCGLPLADAGSASGATPRFCCYGCRFAAGVTQASGDVGQARALMVRLGLSLFFTMNVMAFTMYLWTQDSGAERAAAAAYYDLGRYVCLLFATPVLLLLAGPLVEDAWEELRHGRPSMSGLLVAGVVAAFVYSVVSVIREQGHVYFEVTCMVLVAVTLGRWFEAQGKLQTTAALRSLQQLLPDTVRVVDNQGERQVPRDQVAVGSTIRVLAGERIPLDAVVQRGWGAVDQQAVTGESVPVVKQPGDPLYSGTLNLEGELLVAATARSDAGTMQRIITAVAQALTRRDRYQRLAERISAWFLPGVFVIALGALAVHGARSGLADGLLAALAVIVIACPCALGLATPMALWAAVGRAARHQVLLRDGDSLDHLAQARVFGFDKTGTLTTGAPRVRRIVPRDSVTEHDLLATAAALAQASTHPVSLALVAAAQERGYAPPTAEDVRTLAGRGLSGQVTPRGEVLVGSLRLLRERLGEAGSDLGGVAVSSAWDDEPTDPESDDEAGPLVGVAWSGRLQGVVRLVETLRPSAAPCVAWLVRQGCAVEVLTGDRAARAARLARELNVPVRGDQLPEDKLHWVESQRAAGGVVMVGDGINDAPALAAANVGVALGCGTDISRYTASVCLLGNDLTRLPWLTELARRTVSTIRWNLFWAFAYNIIGIGIAAAGWLNPIFAALAMTVSSLIVVTNSLRLGREALPGEIAEAVATTEGERTERVTGDAATAGASSLAAWSAAPSGERSRHAAGTAVPWSEAG